MPTYIVKWPDEAAWTAVLLAVGGLLTVIGREAGWSVELTGAVVGTVTAVGRLVLGAILPTPSTPEAVADARKHTEPK